MQQTNSTTFMRLSGHKHGACNSYQHRKEQDSQEQKPCCREEKNQQKSGWSTVLLGKICRKGKDSNDMITDYKIPSSAFASSEPALERA